MLLGALASFAALAQDPQPRPAAPAAPAALSSAAERVYELARPRILQIRTLLQSAGRQSSIGSGFVVGDGLAITNYHVVARHALDPGTYRLEYQAPDGSKGGLKLVAFDVAHDLAVVKLERTDVQPFAFDPRAIAGTLPKGERIFAIGNPFDLGFTIVEGNYNGMVDKSYDERIHFSGAINPGMSGGPVTAADGRVVGVNVSKLLAGEQVSFLVPAKFAAALLERVRGGATLDLARAKEEVGRQLDTRQVALYGALTSQGFRSADFGPYRGMESAAPWMSCWASTNADAVPKPRAQVNTTRCSSATDVFVSDRILTGRMELSYSYYRAIDLNAFQFARELSQRSQGFTYERAGKRLTELECRDDFVEAGPGKPAVRATWCMQGYREFPGLYNVTMLVLTQDRSREALVARLTMRGVSQPNAVTLGRRFLEGIEWRR
jgi:serine protease Do